MKCCHATASWRRCSSCWKTASSRRWPSWPYRCAWPDEGADLCRRPRRAHAPADPAYAQTTAGRGRQAADRLAA
ncbi:hypothetical protein G6F46_015796 [Rhizopus delemar]|nr:hypothetical protein G6F46_015796 [Rhizopus delemar]